MTFYEPGDRVCVLYLSRADGTCLAYNRTVIDVVPDRDHGQRVWVNMPGNAALGSPLEFFADDREGLSHMEDEPIESQAPGKLTANLDWYIEAAAPNSARYTWPWGRGHKPVRVAFTDTTRTLHARMAAHYIEQLRFVDPRSFEDWIARFQPTPAPM
ncbi:hypothetical protein [Streptomyces noursei]|uniref:hypothetical protein n=1 Tax=Streptomyces noursei TaxID=1971 RepID=UPI0030F024BA